MCLRGMGIDAESGCYGSWANNDRKGREREGINILTTVPRVVSSSFSAKVAPMYYIRKFDKSTVG